ncbi:acyl carrier protein [Burkholderia pseudomallei]|uniref:acyl carrier protein n=1 Tax=Burkholderia pseudomallei TaxID=28450 RepID=UPI0013212842|nr:acyl carrier protein [Burkholderia pseudomallei]MWA22876.1 acyl carrier protein [Burkholderia pseudomallei]
MENVEQKIKKVVADQLGLNEAEIKLTDSFTTDLGADSLDRVELIMALEDALGISIPDKDSEKLETVQQVIDYMQSVADTE